MKIHDEFKRYVFNEDVEDELWPELMVRRDGKRFKRIQPTCLEVNWRRNGRAGGRREWVLHGVTIHGRRVRQGELTPTLVLHQLYPPLAGSATQPEYLGWVNDLVALSHPDIESMLFSAVISLVDAIL